MSAGRPQQYTRLTVAAMSFMKHLKTAHGDLGEPCLVLSTCTFLRQNMINTETELYLKQRVNLFHCAGVGTAYISDK